MIESHSQFAIKALRSRDIVLCLSFDQHFDFRTSFLLSCRFLFSLSSHISKAFECTLRWIFRNIKITFESCQVSWSRTSRTCCRIARKSSLRSVRWSKVSQRCSRETSSSECVHSEFWKSSRLYYRDCRWILSSSSLRWFDWDSKCYSTLRLDLRYCKSFKFRFAELQIVSKEYRLKEYESNSMSASRNWFFSCLVSQHLILDSTYISFLLSAFRQFVSLVIFATSSVSALFFSFSWSTMFENLSF